MKRCSLFCAGVWPFIVLPLFLLMPLLFLKWHAIEADVASNTQEDLKSIDAKWAKVETRNLGREVLITGTPPNKAAIETVRQKAEQSYGVNSVTISADVEAPILPAQLNANIAGSSIELSGTLIDQAAIDQVVTQAKAVFGADNVINKLQAADSIAKLPNLAGYFKTLSNKTSELNTFNASLDGQNLVLEGNVSSTKAVAELNTMMVQEFALDVVNKLRVVSPPIKLDSCSDVIEQLFEIGQINFATGRAAIDQSSFTSLENIKSAVQKCPDARFEVSGHTDSTGNAEFNRRLSEQRAQAVVSYLKGLGLDTRNFTAVGYGPEQAIADNATAEGRAMNRRIEFKLKR